MNRWIESSTALVLATVFFAAQAQTLIFSTQMCIT